MDRRGAGPRRARCAARGAAGSAQARPYRRRAAPPAAAAVEQCSPQHGPAAARARGRAPARPPRRVRRGGHLQVPGAQGGHAQGARTQRPAGAAVRRGHRGPRAAHRQDLLLLLLLGVRLAVPADGRVLQADGHERRPVRAAHRHAALRGVPVRALLGRAGRPLAQGPRAAAGVAGRVDRVHAAAELGPAGRRGVRAAAQRQRLPPGGAALRRRLARAAAPLPRARRRARRLAAARDRRRQLRARRARLGDAAALLHRVQHARHPEDVLPAAAARRHRRVLQRARHHAGRLRRHHAARGGRRQVRPPAHVRLAGLGAGHVLRGHRAGPQHGLQHAPVRRPAALREELHHLLRHLLRAHGRRAHHRHADPLQVFAQTTREMPEWVTVLRQFQNVKAASFLLVAWFMGFGIGLIFTFLFWHLQDIGGSPTLFGVASVINHISEIFAYFFSFKLITQMGHVKVLCLGLAGNVVRFLYISWLTAPWWVLPFEFVQGVTHAAVWAACCSYIAHGSPPNLRSSAQGVLQGLHHGLGRGCGAVLGGVAVARWGTTRTFAGYGLLCGVALAAFAFVNFRGDDAPAADDDARVLAEAGVLAPHGVPSNPLPRALSSSRLADLAPDSYGATAQAAPAAPHNPFLAEPARR